MPTLAAAVAAFHHWPDVPPGWERHMTMHGNEYPPDASIPAAGFGMDEF